jgi:hypothetical protein
MISGMLLYSPHITPRLSYITEFISNEFFGEPHAIRICSDRALFIAAGGARINYSNEIIGGCIDVRPQGLLFETGVHPVAIDCFLWNDQKVFFGGGGDREGDLPFDIFSASFYLLSRYEEYLPHPTDEYGRFAHPHSLAFREGFLHQPLVNHWLQAFRKFLSTRFPALVYAYPVFKLTPTNEIGLANS